MPAKSPEALKRKAENLKSKRRAATAARHAINSPKLSNAARRRMMPRLPVDVTKSQLRAMITAAVLNTVAQ